MLSSRSFKYILVDILNGLKSNFLLESRQCFEIYVGCGLLFILAPLDAAEGSDTHNYTEFEMIAAFLYLDGVPQRPQEPCPTIRMKTRDGPQTHPPPDLRTNRDRIGSIQGPQEGETERARKAVPHKSGKRSAICSHTVRSWPNGQDRQPKRIEDHTDDWSMLPPFRRYIHRYR